MSGRRKKADPLADKCKQWSEDAVKRLRRLEVELEQFDESYQAKRRELVQQIEMHKAINSEWTELLKDR